MRREVKVFLDMDGVIAAFVPAICSLHNRPSPYLDPNMLGTFELEKGWGITPEEFWAPVERNSLEFWKNVPKTEEAEKLVRLVSRTVGAENVAILTAPSEDIGSVHGKRIWIHRNFPQFNKRLIFAAAGTKKFLAGPGKLLIDDRDRNVDQFIEAGGEGIVVPRPWNRDYQMSDSTYQVVADRLYTWEESLYA